MTCENLIKNKNQPAFNSLLARLSIERKLTDDQMEYMQFDIYDYSPRQVEEVSFFHYSFGFILKEKTISSSSPNQEIR